MIRKMTLAEDNIPKLTRVSETVATSTGSIFVETGFMVSWGMVQNASVGQISSDDEVGPVFFSPNTPTSNLLYNVGDISSSAGDIYVSGSLQLYYNGILLTKDLDYTEETGNEEFTLIIGDSLLTNPDVSDNFAIKYVKNVTFTSPTPTTTIVVRVPETETGFYIDYENVSGSLLVVDVIYR